MLFYDLMVQIWGGAPATEPLSFGVQSHQAVNEQLVMDDDGNACEEGIEEGKIQQGSFSVTEVAKISFQSSSGEILLIIFNHHASVLPSLTQTARFFLDSFLILMCLSFLRNIVRFVA
eukprot:gene10160-11200_t